MTCSSAAARWALIAPADTASTRWCLTWQHGIRPESATGSRLRRSPREEPTRELTCLQVKSVLLGTSWCPSGTWERSSSSFSWRGVLRWQTAAGTCNRRWFPRESPYSRITCSSPNSIYRFCGSIWRWSMRLRDNSKLTSQIRCNGIVPFRYGSAVFETERGYQTPVRFEAGRIFFSVQIGSHNQARLGTGSANEVEHRSEEHTSELQSRQYLVFRLL